ncbi:MAG: glycosyltransferase [Gemmataceae bacterium]
MHYLILSRFSTLPAPRPAPSTPATRLGKRLVVIGSGQGRRQAPRTSRFRLIQVLGWQDNGVLRDHLRRCQALLFPGEEDFGIVPVEAQACGTPVIAFGKGGATETVIPLGESDHPTGVWFAEQAADPLAAIRRLEASRPPGRALRRHAETFATSDSSGKCSTTSASPPEEGSPHAERESLPSPLWGEGLGMGYSLRRPAFDL